VPGAQVLTSVVILSNMVSTSSGNRERDGLPLEREIDRAEEAVKVNLYNLESATRMPPSKVTLDDEVDDLDGILSPSLVLRPVGLMPAS